MASRINDPQKSVLESFSLYFLNPLILFKGQQEIPNNLTKIECKKNIIQIMKTVPMFSMAELDPYAILSNYVSTL